MPQSLLESLFSLLYSMRMDLQISTHHMVCSSLHLEKNEECLISSTIQYHHSLSLCFQGLFLLSSSLSLSPVLPSSLFLSLPLSSFSFFLFILLLSISSKPDSTFDTNLLLSSAAYSLPCYFFGITDRNQDNIMHFIENNKLTGHSFHIDFGHIMKQPQAKANCTILGIKSSVWDVFSFFLSFFLSSNLCLYISSLFTYSANIR